MSKKILITGGAGFIGSNIARVLEERFPNYEITIFDKFNSGEKRDNGHFEYFGDFKNLKNINCKVVSGDLKSSTDVENLLKESYDVIFHQAAISDTTVTNQTEVLITNTNSFDYFLNYAKRKSCTLIYASSAGVYGNSAAPNLVGFGELPENIYGYSKLAMDMMARSFISSNPGIRVVGLRYFNVYGPGELYKRRTSSMILQLAKQALESRKIRLFKHGEQKRDFVYISDVVDANINAMEAESGIYNIGSGISRSFNDIYKCIQDELESNINVEYFDNPYSFYQNNTCAELVSSNKGISYTPKVSLEEGIHQYINVIKQYNQTEWKSFNE